jgi:hypothetical protein
LRLLRRIVDACTEGTGTLSYERRRRRRGHVFANSEGDCVKPFGVQNSVSLDGGADCVRHGAAPPQYHIRDSAEGCAAVLPGCYPVDHDPVRLFPKFAGAS